MELETSTKNKSTDFERVRIEEGIYNAKLQEVKDISDGTYGARVVFIYNVEHSTSVNLGLVCYKTKATENNRIGQTLMAHGVVINDKKVNTDNLPQKQVRVWVEDFEYEEEVDGAKVKKTASSISKVKPITEKVE